MQIQKKPNLKLLFLFLPFYLFGCATTQTTSSSQVKIKPIETLYIKAQKNASGEYEFESYDAKSLFVAAIELTQKLQCDEAVKLYDQIVEEFPESRFVSASLYNAGLCLKQSGILTEAVKRFESLLSKSTNETDIKHTLFQLCDLTHQLELSDKLTLYATRLVEREDLNQDERIEASARKAQSLLLEKKWMEAEELSKENLRYGKRLNQNHQVTDVYFLAASSFVVAESYQERASEILIPSADVNTQHEVLESRAQLMLKAQKAYFDTIRFKEAHWAAASGYQIGKMYDALWEAIMHAPVPPSDEPLSSENQKLFENEYRQKLAKLVKPLIHHSVRYWELTLNMIKRTQVQTHWTKKIEADLEKVKLRLQKSEHLPKHSTET